MTLDELKCVVAELEDTVAALCREGPAKRPIKFEMRIPGPYGHDKVAYITPIYEESAGDAGQATKGRP